MAYTLIEDKKANDKRYYQANKERIKERTRRNWFVRKYGLTIEEFNLLWEKQRGRCAICGIVLKQTMGLGSNTGTYHTDHDHFTNKVRGILCIQCNLGLGNFKDDVVRLRAAIYYLERG